MSSSAGLMKRHPDASRSSSTITNEPSDSSWSACHTRGDRTGRSLPTAAYSRASATPRPIWRRNFRCSLDEWLQLDEHRVGQVSRRGTTRHGRARWCPNGHRGRLCGGRSRPDLAEPFRLSGPLRCAGMVTAPRPRCFAPRGEAEPGIRRHRRCAPDSAKSPHEPPSRRPSDASGPWARRSSRSRMSGMTRDSRLMTCVRFDVDHPQPGIGLLVLDDDSQALRPAFRSQAESAVASATARS